MRTTHRAQRPTSRSALAVGVCSSSAWPGLAACGSSSSGGTSAGGGGGGGGDKGVSLIIKTLTNPFFVAMQKGAKKAATAKDNVKLTVAAGKAGRRRQSQIRRSRTPSPAATRAS